MARQLVGWSSASSHALQNEGATNCMCLMLPPMICLLPAPTHKVPFRPAKMAIGPCSDVLKVLAGTLSAYELCATFLKR